jgi:hypothetical protein
MAFPPILWLFRATLSDCTNKVATSPNQTSMHISPDTLLMCLRILSPSTLVLMVDRTLCLRITPIILVRLISISRWGEYLFHLKRFATDIRIGHPSSIPKPSPCTRLTTIFTSLRRLPPPISSTPSSMLWMGHTATTLLMARLVMTQLLILSTQTLQQAGTKELANAESTSL